MRETPPDVAIHELPSSSIDDIADVIVEQPASSLTKFP